MAKAATKTDAHKRRIHDDWARRHPALAAEERALRKGQAEALSRYGRIRGNQIETLHDGTAETRAKAAKVRQGSLARLYVSGAIDIAQLGAAQEIASVAERITGPLGLRTMSLETRVSGGSAPQQRFYEALGAVRREMAYTAWRQALPQPWPVLAMVVDDLGLKRTARQFGLGERRAKQLLIAALDLWPALMRDARDRVDDATLAAAWAGLG